MAFLNVKKKTWMDCVAMLGVPIQNWPKLVIMHTIKKDYKKGYHHDKS